MLNEDRALLNNIAIIRAAQVIPLCLFLHTTSEIYSAKARKKVIAITGLFVILLNIQAFSFNTGCFMYKRLA